MLHLDHHYAPLNAANIISQPHLPGHSAQAKHANDQPGRQAGVNPAACRHIRGIAA
jgi:hypothetical protein